ncbi:inorganic phosphate transporter [Celerinatantimonas sp. YJH-8]|uniref:inorganic phosphate transporter n=1 Tax=Celerinatantimonas sp. YJH-8 TaxID=3228714 RepID=UPI0038CA6142
MEVIANYGTTLVLVAAFFGFIMAWGIGANDVANAMGTSVGSGVLTIRKAVIIAMIFEFTGAYLAGGEVTNTVRKGIIDPALFSHEPHLLVYGMISALLAAGFWLLIASYQGWPVSTTHSIIGAIIGFACVSVGPDSVEWSQISSIVGSWIITPIIAGVISYLLFTSAQLLIFNHSNPIVAAKRYVPGYMFLAGLVLSLVTIKKGLSHVGLHLGPVEGYLLAILIGLIIAVIGRLVINRLHIDPHADKQMHYTNVEKIFAILMVMTACCMAFAHGSNDVANAIGPLAAVVSVISHHGIIEPKAQLAWWILPLGGLGIVAGLAILGHHVIATVGKGITHLTPSRGFAAELSAASTVVIASGTGLPISTTQTLVGAILGVGMARGIGALNLGIIRKIVISWVITLPAGAIFAIIFYYILKACF